MRLLIAAVLSLVSDSAGRVEELARRLKEGAAREYLNFAIHEDVGDLYEQFTQERRDYSYHRRVDHVFDLDGHLAYTRVQEPDGRFRIVH